MTTSTVFSLADARELRQNAQRVTARSAADFDLGSSPLQRYVRHYGFDALFTHRQFTYTLSFEPWAGYRISRHSWALADELAKGTVVLAHGLFDHTGLYLRLVARLLDEGFNVVSFDLPGHGLSDGAEAAITEFREYSDVFSDCLASCAEMPGPYHAIGQSTGCSAIVDFLFNSRGRGAKTDPLDKTVLLAPLVRAHAWQRVSLAHSLLGRWIKSVPRQFGTNSHDGAFLHFLKCEDPLQARHIDMGWVKAMRHWEKLFRKAPVIEASMLIVQGTADNTVDWRWNIPHLQHHVPQAQVRYLEGAHHHLVGERDPWRRNAFDALCQFLQPFG